MIRRALIIYCNDIKSGELNGPPADNDNYRAFLKSNLGGHWYDNEIISLPNPSIERVRRTIASHFQGANYSFTIFTGHGYINTKDKYLQYLELSNGDISILELRSLAERQTIIVDACRGYYTPIVTEIKKALDVIEERYFAAEISTRKIFDNWLEKCEKGLSILYSASENETSLDSDNGAVYLLSLIAAAEYWDAKSNKYLVLPLNLAHELAVMYMRTTFETIQVPKMSTEKRLSYFPFAVRFSSLEG